MNRRIVACIVSVLLLATVQPARAFADNQKASAGNRYYYSNTVSAGEKGYSQAGQIPGDDPHFGWELGRFVVSGFTMRAEGDTPIFLKNSGDEITLSFVLDWDIDALNGDEEMTVAQDKDGFDEYFGVERQDFGRGTLIVRHVDYQNASSAPQVFVDYLSALEVGAETKINVFEEGDYEVALDYEVESPGLIPFLPKHTNYRIFFRFKVRNSNAMAFLFDVETGSELYDGTVTSRGFRLDLAQSHYLEVNVQRKVMNDTGDGIVEDVRFNRSATDGDVFSDEGIYVVTIKNPTTGEQTTKTIYVGENDVLKASVANQMDVSEVNAQIAQGAIVAEDGTLMLPAVTPVASEDPEGESVPTDSTGSNDSEQDQPTDSNGLANGSANPGNLLQELHGVMQVVPAPVLFGACIIAAALLGFGLGRRKRGNGK